MMVIITLEEVKEAYGELLGDEQEEFLKWIIEEHLKYLKYIRDFDKRIRISFKEQRK